MRDEFIKRDYFWVVEAVDRSGKVLFNGTYCNFDRAWEKYYSFKNKATVSLQRRYKEYKVA